MRRNRIRDADERKDLGRERADEKKVDARRTNRRCEEVKK
jgi:hypothetical protein